MSMTMATKMLMLRGRNNDGGRENQYRYDGGTNNRYEINRYEGANIDGRFRDRRGREHYDNGRFAPMRSEYGGMEQRRYMTPEDPGRRGPRSDGGMDMRSGYPYHPPWYEGGEEMNANPIGFHYGSEGHDGGDYAARIRYLPMNKMKHHEGADDNEEFSEEHARKWVSKMKNADKSQAPKWSMADANTAKAKRKLNMETWELWTVMNMLYSDYSEVAAKYGVNNADFYADLAVAFLEDPDANPNKLARYYEEVAKH